MGVFPSCKTRRNSMLQYYLLIKSIEFVLSIEKQ